MEGAMNPKVFFASQQIAAYWDKKNIHRVTVSASTGSIKKNSFVGSVDYMWRNGTAINGGRSECLDANLRVIKDPIALAEQLNATLKKMRRDTRFWRLSVSPEFGFVIKNLPELVLKGIRRYSDRVGYNLNIFLVEHHDTPFRHVHALIPEVQIGYDHHRNKRYLPIQFPFRRIVTDLKYHIGIFIEEEIGTRPKIPMLLSAIEAQRWTAIDDRIHLRMLNRVIDMNPNCKEFTERYQLVEHVEEVARLRKLIKMNFAKQVTKNSFLLLPSYDQELLPTIQRGLDRPLQLTLPKDTIVTLKELEKTVVLDTRLLTSRSLFPDPYEADYTSRRLFYEPQHYARLELNRDLESMKIVGFSEKNDIDRAMKAAHMYVVLADERTGFLRVAHLSDIAQERAHLLSPTLVPRCYGIDNVEHSELNYQEGLKEIKRYMDLGVTQEILNGLETEGEFLRRWQLFQKRGEQKVEFARHRKIEKHDVAKEAIQELKKELQREAPLEIGHSDELELEQDLGLSL